MTDLAASTAIWLSGKSPGDRHPQRPAIRHGLALQGACIQVGPDDETGRRAGRERSQAHPIRVALEAE